MKFTVIPSLVALVALIRTANAGSRCPKYSTKLFRKTSHTASGLRGKIEEYRRALGGEDNASNAGPISEGHRSINWDADAVPFNMPFDFFDKTVTRGAEFSAKQGKFVVSNPTDGSDDRFDSFVGRNIAEQLDRFSLNRLFSPLKENKFHIRFNVPAKSHRAAVTGFGAIFSDVDKNGKTKMTYFDNNGCVIARVDVAAKSKGLSFVGITVMKDGKLLAAVAKIAVTLGDKSLSETKVQRRSGDFVAVDDLIYGEPQKI